MNTPFIDFKAPEIAPEKQKQFFVEPKHIKRIISPKASVIIGERGSGKTTLLCHLEKTFNYLEDFEYIGLYYRFETANVKALNSAEMTSEQNIAVFSQYLAAVLGKLLCQFLENTKKSRGIVFENEKSHCQKLMSELDFTEKNNICSYEDLKEIYELIRKRVVVNLQNGKYVCYFDYTSFVDSFCQELKKEHFFSNSCFCVLLDEYENLTLSQQKVVNSAIKGSSYYLTYKVCMRPDGFLTKETVADKEPLMIGHDYEEFEYVKDIVGLDKEVKGHLRNICANRLEYFYNQNRIEFMKDNLEIDSYLDIVSDESDIESWERIAEYEYDLKEKLKRRYPNETKSIEGLKVIDLKLINLLREKGYGESEIFTNISSKTEKYKNWIHNYKKNIIYLIASECEQTKKYCGFETIIKLANNNTRTVLEILHYSFGELNNEDKVYSKISVKRQTQAINRVSKSSFEQIDYIPFNGYKAKNLTNALGNMFSEFLHDSRAKKFEVNSFCIIVTEKNDERIKELKIVLRDAVVWGVLIPSKATKIKNKGDIVLDGRDYVLHPIFAPYFNISYRKRQKCELKDVEIYSMFLPKPRRELKKVSNQLFEEYYQEEFKWS